MVLLAGISVLIVVFSLVSNSESAPLAIRLLSIASALFGAVLGLFCLFYSTYHNSRCIGGVINGFTNEH